MANLIDDPFAAIVGENCKPPLEIKRVLIGLQAGAIRPGQCMPLTHFKDFPLPFSQRSLKAIYSNEKDTTGFDFVSPQLLSQSLAADLSSCFAPITGMTFSFFWNGSG